MSKNKRQIRLFSILSTLLMFFSLITPGFVSAESSNNTKRDMSLREFSVPAKEKLSNSLLEKFDEEDKVRILVRFTEKADLESATKKARSLAQSQNLSPYRTELAQRSAVISELKSTAFQSQGKVKEFLQTEAQKGNVEDLKSYYIVNMVALTTTKEVAEKLATFAEVDKIVPNEFRVSFSSNTISRDNVKNLPTRTEKDLTVTEPMDSIEWNIERINAPDVWGLDIDGTGIIVANMDTGVQWDHPALKEKYLGYNPETDEVDHTFSFYDPVYGDTEAYDLDGHGTHVMGTMVGGEADGSNQIGVAPGAKWIAVQAFTVIGNDVGAYDEHLIAGAEWLLAPGGDVSKAPVVVNNSWGGGPGIDEFFMDAVDSWRAAGIVPVFAAGNVTLSNPGGPGSVSSPGNYPQSFAVGNTNRDDMVSAGSLRGPSPYGEIKPDVSAPGSGIRSAVPNDSYASYSGTSMAAPHVAGLVALLRQASSFSDDLEERVNRIEQVIMETARERTDSEYPESPNNGYGHGIIDAFAAVSTVVDGLGNLEGFVTTDGEDTEPPVYEHTPPSTIFSSQNVSLSIFASDNISITSVKVLYDGKEVEAKQVSGNHKSGEFVGVVPSEDITDDEFSYQFKITDYGNNEVITEIFTVEVSDAIFFEDFATNPNWEVFVGGGPSSWEWGVPTSGPGSAKTGDHVYATNLSGNYYPNEFSWLDMPVVNIPAGEAYLVIDHWYDIEDYYHTGYIAISDNPLTDFLILDALDGHSGGWVTGVYDISAYSGADAYISFIIETDLFAFNDGWYIDSVLITNSLPENVSAGNLNNFVMESSGLPLEATVSVLETGRTVNTNPRDGSFNMLHPAGEFTIVAESYGYYSGEQTVNIIEDGTSEVSFVLEELPTGTVTGTITDVRTGEPIEDARLFLIEDANVEPVTTDADGNYELTAYEGTYTLRIMALDYHPHEIEIEISGDLNLDIELEPFFTVPGGEIGYDDGTAENARAFFDGGNGWGVRMSLPEGVESALVTDGVFQFHDSDWPSPGGTAFAVEVWSAGDDGMPGERIAGPIEAEAIRDLSEWTVVDLREENIQVDGDFYMVYIQTQDNTQSPGLATDEDGPFAGRSYQYVDGAWNQSPQDNGNYMIRSRIAIGVGDPTITSPTDGQFTNEKDVTVDGNGTILTTVKLFNNGEEVDSKFMEDYSFSFDIELTEGENVLQAKSYVEDDVMATESDTVTVVLDTIAPDITIQGPVDGDKTNKETVVVEGTVIDANLDFVEVNGERAAVTGNKFSKRIMLNNGENDITVVAYDLAGNMSTETITIDVKYDTPVIESVYPTADQYLAVGEKLKVEFNGEPGLTASFNILMPQFIGTSAEGDVHDYTLVEESEGYYVGYFTVTEDISVAGGTLRIKATDAYGNTTYVESDAKLFLNQDPFVERIYGETRFATSVQISQEGWKSASTVILTRSDEFADALAGVPLAHKLNAPILLTRNNELMPEIEAEIERLGATEVIVLGGQNAISDDVVSVLEDNGLTVTRLAGETRYETAAEIARYLAPEGADKVVVANGLNFPDALSIASYAAQEGMPILLSRNNELVDATASVIEELNASTTYVIGGQTMISDDVAGELPGATRLSGPTRYDTNIAIMNEFGKGANHMYVATGLNFTDVLTGAVLAAKNETGVLLVRNDRVPPVVSDFISSESLKHLTIFGGSGAVSDEVRDTLFNLIQ